VEVTGGPKKLKSVVAPTEGVADPVEEYETVELPDGGFEIRQVAAAAAPKEKAEGKSADEESESKEE
jgi:hypothetical protein